MIDRSLNYGRHLVREFLSRAQFPSVIVDLGAGHGTDLELAREAQPAAELHAVECWQPYINELSRKNIKVHTLNIERDSLPFSEHSVDVFIANQILEHTKEIFWIFHQVSRALRVGGYFIIGVPNLASFHNRILLSLGRQPSQIKSHSAHVRGFTKGDLVSFVNHCFPEGYALEAYGGSNFYPFPPSLAKPPCTCK